MGTMKLATCAWGVAVAAVAASSAALARPVAVDPVAQTAVETDPGEASAAQQETASPATAGTVAGQPPSAAPAAAGTGASADNGTEKAKATIDLEQVVVTAQRREEKLQDVPVTITAFTAEQISEARISDIASVATRTPGFGLDAYPASQPRVSIRGIRSSDRGAAGDPSAAVFVDEIYLGRPAAVAFDAFDIERIEVLKGPQGTLYGRNVVGGAVNVITRKPELTQFDAAAEMSAGDYGRVEGAGFVNVPFADGRAAVRASASVRQHDGYTKNTHTGGRQDDQDDSSARVQLAFNPSDSVRLLASLDGTRSRAAGPGQHVLDLDEDDPLSALWTVSRDRDHTAADFDGHQDKDTWGARLQGDVDLSFGTLTYLGSYRDLDYSTNYDLDGGNPDTNLIQISGGTPETSRFRSNELRLSSLPESPVRWVAGVYTYGIDTDRSDILDLDLGDGPVRDIFQQHAKLDSFAAFGDITVPVGERFHVIGGVRYSKDDKDYHIANTESDVLVRSQEPFDVRVSDSWDALTWRVGGDFKLADDHLLYVMVSRGFKSGGFADNPGTAQEAATSFRPEFATQYEVGQKSTFLGGKLTWNNTLYWMDYTDLQTNVVQENLTVVTNNAGKATIKGYETYFNWRAFAGASITAAYAWTDAVFDVYDAGPDVSYAGNRLTRTPRSKVVLSPSYDLRWASGAMTRFAVDYRYESRIYDDETNAGPEQRDPTNFVDARILYTDPSGHWTFSLWGQNLTNELTRTFQGTVLGANFGTYNPPRTYGATLSWIY